MANYFVSVNGNDITGNGLSVATAWRTINKALSTIPQIDVFHNVYVEPGIYRLDDEGGPLGYDMTYPVLGNYTDFAKVIGDINGEHFGTKGIVRVTACDEDEQMQDRRYVECLKCHTEFWYIQFDGNNANIWTGGEGKDTIWGMNSSDNSIYFHFCKIYNNCRMFYIGEFYNCVIEGGQLYAANYYGYGNNAKFCDTILINVNYLQVTTTTVYFYNCILMSGTYIQSVNSTKACIFVNCLAIGFEEAFRGMDDRSVNNLAIGCRYAFHYGSPKNCVAIDCERPFYNSTATDCYYSGVFYTIGSATGVTRSNDLGLLRFDYDLLRKAFEPMMGVLLQGKGTRDVTVRDTDMWKLPQNSVDGSGIDVGAYRVDTIAEDVDNLSFEIEREGVKILTLPCKAGIETTITCDIVSTGTTSRPEIRIYDQDNTLIDSDVATSDSDTLSVSITPDHDYVYRVWLYATDSTSGAYTEFSNLKINNVDATINDNGEIYPVIYRTEDVETPVITPYEKN